MVVADLEDEVVDGDGFGAAAGSEFRTCAKLMPLISLDAHECSTGSAYHFYHLLPNDVFHDASCFDRRFGGLARDVHHL